MDYTILISLFSLILMEIVLGIDNVIFISIISDKLPHKQQAKARTIGLLLALGMRIILLLTIAWSAKASEPFMELFGIKISIKDLIFMSGGMFLLWKSPNEIYENLEGERNHSKTTRYNSMKMVIVQIVFLDTALSFDSILTAIGLVKQVSVMITAMAVSIAIIILLINKISDFINRHPSIKMLALNLLLLIGFILILEGFNYIVPRGFVYFTIFFTLGIEIIKLKTHKGFGGKSSKN